MKRQNAELLVQKLINNQAVSLRKAKCGISERTWDSVCDVLFTEYTVESIGVKYTKDGNCTIARINAFPVINDAIIRLYEN